MCTAIRIGDCFGRNLDLDYSFNQNVIFIPAKFNIKYNYVTDNISPNKVLGMGIVIDNYPLLSDGFNQFGLAGAGLNFPNNAKFFPYDKHKINISPYELLPYILRNFKSVKEVKSYLNKVNFLDKSFSNTLPLAPLHYIFADKNESIVVESSYKGLVIYDNQFDVLTNNPDFEYHKNNANRYLNLTNQYPTNKIPNLKLEADSVGFGSMGLLGDYSSSSRFIKAFYLAKFVNLPKEDSKKIATFINCLTSLSFIQGVCKSVKGEFERTLYSSCMDLTNLTYSYKTECGLSIHSINMDEPSLDSLKIYDLLD